MTLKDIKEKTLLHLFIIATVGVLAYSNTFHVPFQWDEPLLIGENPIVKNLDFFLSPSKAIGVNHGEVLRNRYIGYLSFALNYKIHGLEVEGYHIVNLLIHILTAFTVYYFVLFLFRTPFLKTTFEHDITKMIGLFSALIFVAHPIQTEAVTYIFQRLASLVALFYLLSLVLYIKYRLLRLERSSERDFRPAIFYLLSIITCIAATKTKENSFTLPISIFLFSSIFFLNNKKDWFKLVPFGLSMLIIPFSMGTSMQNTSVASELWSTTEGIAASSNSGYFFTQMRVMVMYLRLILMPINQVVSYDYRNYWTLFDPEVLASVLLHIFIISSGIYMLIKSKTAPLLKVFAFGIFWFYITLSVESSVIPIPMTICEYRVYLPSAIFMPSFAVLMFKAGKESIIKRKIIVIGLSMMIVLLSIATIMRNEVWKTQYSLWTDVIKKSPKNPYGYIRLGDVYFNDGDTIEGIKNYYKAIHVRPTRIDTYVHTSQHLYMAGVHGEALEVIEKALALDNSNPEIYKTLGIVYTGIGDFNKAESNFLKAISLFPTDADAFYNLGILYIEMENFEEAKRQMKIAISCDSTHQPALKALQSLKERSNG